MCGDHRIAASASVNGDRLQVLAPPASANYKQAAEGMRVLYDASARQYVVSHTVITHPPPTARFYLEDTMEGGL